MCLLKPTDQKLELLVATLTLCFVATSLVMCAATLHCGHAVCDAFPVSAFSWEVFVGDFKARNGGSGCLFSPPPWPRREDLAPLLVSTRLGREGSAVRKE